MKKPTSATVCPAVVRQSPNGPEILAFRSSESGNGLITDGARENESVAETALRSMLEASGVAISGKLIDFGQSKGIVQGAVWHFFLCPCPPLPDCWSHAGPADNGQGPDFFWQNLNEYLEHDWDPAFIRAARHIQSRVMKLPALKLDEYCPAPRTDIARTMLGLARQRGANKSIDPLEVARSIAGNDEKEWRMMMKPIRAEAVRLAKGGQLLIKRKGKTVDPDGFKGVYRIALPEPE